MMRITLAILIGILVSGCAQMNGKTQTWIDDGCLSKELRNQTYICVDGRGQPAIVLRLEF